MPYATPAEFMLFSDARLAGDLVDDNEDQQSPENLLTDDVLEAVLARASGDIESALGVGGMYTPADLAALTGNMRYHLVGICCDIAHVYLLRRRGLIPADELKAATELAEVHLERLRTGQNIFNIPNREDAGIIDTTGPSLVDFRDMNLIRDRTRNYYPHRVPATWNQ